MLLSKWTNFQNSPIQCLLPHLQADAESEILLFSVKNFIKFSSWVLFVFTLAATSNSSLITFKMCLIILVDVDSIGKLWEIHLIRLLINSISSLNKINKVQNTECLKGYFTYKALVHVPCEIKFSNTVSVRRAISWELINVLKCNKFKKTKQITNWIICTCVLCRLLA